MKEIKLTQGQVALVSDEDYDFLNQLKWYAVWNHSTKTFYAVRSACDRQIFMHRIILDAPKGIDGDHRNGNTLDNQRHNLRLDPDRRNTQNTKKYSTNTSGYKGVFWNKKANKWHAQVWYKCKIYYLGLFILKEDAARAYNKKALELHGEFARLNVIV